MRDDSREAIMVTQGMRRRKARPQQRTVNMMKLRGDDELFEILDVMGGDHLKRKKVMTDGPDEM